LNIISISKNDPVNEVQSEADDSINSVGLEVMVDGDEFFFAVDLDFEVKRVVIAFAARVVVLVVCNQILDGQLVQNEIEVLHYQFDGNFDRLCDFP
jgi:hypothetical protein